jgi:hypothetical protein
VRSPELNISFENGIKKKGKFCDLEIKPLKRIFALAKKLKNQLFFVKIEKNKYKNGFA